MTHAQRRARIVAICGLDGSGKSTLWHNLRQSGKIANGVFLKREDRRDWRNVFDLHAYHYHTPPMTHEPAIWLRWAHALDMLNFYHTVVAPRLSDDVVLISDRWSYCSMAFAVGLEAHAKAINGLLAVFPRPDLVLFPSVSPDVAFLRIKARGGNVQADETLEELQTLRCGYDLVLPREITVDLTSGTPEEVCCEALEKLSKLMLQ